MTATLPFDFEQHRGFLFGLAYRMLGSASEAEDVVQDTFVRALAAAPAEVERPRNYLATIATRLGLDRLKAARTRRETYVGPWLPEPIPLDPPDPRAGPDEAVLLEDSISYAFLIVLESLTAAERAAFLLHDVFGFDYAEIATMVGRSQATCRQHVHRARERLSERRQRFAASADLRSRLTAAFLQAARSGDVAGLAELLSNDVTLRSDGGGKVPAATRVVAGRDRVMRFLLSPKIVRYAQEQILCEVNGQPAIALSYKGELHTLLVLEPTAGGQIGQVLSIRNPDKLARIAASLGRAAVHLGDAAATSH